MHIEIKKLNDDIAALKQLISLYAKVFETPVFTVPDDPILTAFCRILCSFL